MQNEKTLGQFELRKQTLESIETLLIQHYDDGYLRGLFTREQLHEIRQALHALAHWLVAHKPERIRTADRRFSPKRRFSHKDVLGIAYVDHVNADDDAPPARKLQRFFNQHLAGHYSNLHILPHFSCPVIHPELIGPASRADGGFEPMGYQMDPKYGTPQDLQEISAELMFDFVLNHLSVKGEWFQRFLEDDPEYADFFLTIPADKLNTLDLSRVFRPRQHHPVFEFTNSKGQIKHVWCTFSATQADINIKNPKVFIKVMEALIKDFVGQGASWIRLDAVGYLVKMLGLKDSEPNTSCFGIEETHNVLKAANCFLADVAPSVTLVAEINATKDVISTYYGEDGDESHMVYDFPAAPLSLYTIYSGNAAPMLQWARERTAYPERIGLAFTNSHDGIGVLPMADVPPLADGTTALDFMIAELRRRNAGINYKSQIVRGKPVDVPYEACITWAQALLKPEELEALRNNELSDSNLEGIADRFLASQSFVFAGPHCVPADYLGAIAVLLNDEETFQVTHHNRNKNRGLVDADSFEKALTNPQNNYEKLVHHIFMRKAKLLEARQGSAAFSPYAPCQVDIVEVPGATPEVNPVFSVLRRAPDNTEVVLALTNTSALPKEVKLDPQRLGFSKQVILRDMLSESVYEFGSKMLTFEMQPYQVAWLRIG